MCSECLCTIHTVVDIRPFSDEVPSTPPHLPLSLYLAATPSSSSRLYALGIRHAFSVVVDVRAHDGEGLVALNKDSRLFPIRSSAALTHTRTATSRYCLRQLFIRYVDGPTDLFIPL
jgi:hypothetical protein